MKCNVNSTNYINTSALVMWNVAGDTHTHARNQWHTTSRTQVKQSESRGEKASLEGRLK